MPAKKSGRPKREKGAGDVKLPFPSPHIGQVPPDKEKKKKKPKGK